MLISKILNLSKPVNQLERVARMEQVHTLMDYDQIRKTQNGMDNEFTELVWIQNLILLNTKPKSLILFENIELL